MLSLLLFCSLLSSYSGKVSRSIGQSFVGTAQSGRQVSIASVDKLSLPLSKMSKRPKLKLALCEELAVQTDQTPWERAREKEMLKQAQSFQSLTPPLTLQSSCLFSPSHNRQRKQGWPSQRDRLDRYVQYLGSSFCRVR